MAKKNKVSAAPKPVIPNVATTAKPVEKAPLFNVMLLSIILFALSFLLYYNTIPNGYALDDYNVIRDNSIVTKGASAVGEIFATPYRRGYFITTNDLYRPLSLAMFAIEYELTASDPWLSHFMNILFFAGGVVLLFRFLHRLMNKEKLFVAFTAALLFAVHPIHTEVVANIKSRDELGCFFFAFLSLNKLMDYANKQKILDLLIGLGCYFLSLLSKETTIMYIFVVPIIFFIFINDNKKESIVLSAGVVLVAVLFLAVRNYVLGMYNANTSNFISFMDNMLTKPPTPAMQKATAIAVTLNYLKLMVIPYPLVCDYAYNTFPFVGFNDYRTLLSLAIHGALLGIGVYRLIKIPKDMWAFAVLFYLIMIALFSNVFFLIGAIFAERFAFFASVGFCLAAALAIGWVIQKLGEKGGTPINYFATPLAWGILMLLSIPMMAIVSNRNKDWDTNYTLFKADVPKAQHDSRLLYYLGTEMISTTAVHEGNPQVKRKLIEDGIQYLRQSLAVNPQYDDAQAEIGNAFFQIGQYDSAEIHDLRALKIKPNEPLTTNNLAGVYFVTNRYRDAIDLCKNAIKVNPLYYNSHSNIGLCYYRLKKYDSALYYLYQSRAINSNFSTACENLVLVYSAMGVQDSVKKYQSELIRIKNADAARHL
ncbi:MAG: hypothetical protein EBX41_07610 [Chitinophagia bacterium]|nr:hypothetical protein [Chitinophagia bacterium]